MNLMEVVTLNPFLKLHEKMREQERAFRCVNSGSTAAEYKARVCESGRLLTVG